MNPETRWDITWTHDEKGKRQSQLNVEKIISCRVYYMFRPYVAIIRGSWVYENIDRITYATIKFISNSDLILLHNALSTVSKKHFNPVFTETLDKTVIKMCCK
jgi:hypothetical protein